MTKNAPRATRHSPLVTRFLAWYDIHQKESLKSKEYWTRMNAEYADKKRRRGTKMANAILKHREITELVLKAFFNVYNELGYGFLENVYENAMAIEATDLGLEVGQQVPIDVIYKKCKIGHYEADLLVNDLIIVELKAVEDLIDKHEAQLLNYLKATRFEVGLLLNFGPKPSFKRKAFDNSRKGSLSWVGSGKNNLN